MKINFIALFAFMLSLSLLSCGSEKCHNISDGSYDEVIVQFIVYPEDFDPYISNRRSSLSDIFFMCLDNKITQFETSYNNALDECDRLYLSYGEPDLLTGCRNDAYTDYYETLELLYTLEGYSDGNPSLTHILKLDFMIDMKFNSPHLFSPAEYETMMLQTIESTQGSYKCQLMECDD